MRLAAALSGIAYFAGMALSSDAQPCNPPNAVHAEAQNLSFSEGTLGNAPPGWFLGPEWFMPPHAPVYEAKIAQGASCNGSQQCAALHSISDSSSIRLGFLYQVVDAAQYRGKNLVFHADVRADAAREALRGCWFGYTAATVAPASAMIWEIIQSRRNHGRHMKSTRQSLRMRGNLSLACS